MNKPKKEYRINLSITEDDYLYLVAVSNGLEKSINDLLRMNIKFLKKAAKDQHFDYADEGRRILADKE